MEKSVRLACDLLDAPTTQSELLFLSRHDAEEPSEEIFAYAKKKFYKVHYWRCSLKGSGYPQGCNDLAYGLFQYMADQRSIGHYPDISSLLILESDCVITRKTWVEELQAEWNKHLAQGRKIVGAIQMRGQWGQDTDYHVNAVAMYHPDILRFIPTLANGPADIGWDYYHRHVMLNHAGDTKLIKLDFRRESITEEELYGKQSDVLIYHGVKGDSAINAVRNHHNLK